ncbi:hypothetical protein U1Q18_046364 [Sarracenia purpurea var. burkii]
MYRNLHRIHAMCSSGFLAVLALGFPPIGKIEVVGGDFQSRGDAQQWEQREDFSAEVLSFFRSEIQRKIKEESQTTVEVFRPRRE